MYKYLPGLSVLLLVLGGCASSAPKLDTGRGLHWNYGEERLQREGYPGSAPDKYSSPQWGVLYDEEGIAYGPKSFFSGRTNLEHPYFESTPEYVASRWVILSRSDCCTEPLLGHFLEICDLAWKDLTDELNYVPPVKLHVYSPPTLEDYYAITGVDFVVSFMVSGASIVVQPIDDLFRRTLAGHTAYASIAESLIELKTRGDVPAWLRVGLASYLANEGFEHLSFMAEFRPLRESILLTPQEVERDLVPVTGREPGRVARYNAFLMAWHLSETWGFDRVVRLLDLVEQGSAFGAAVQTVYGRDEAALLEMINPVVLGEPTTTASRTR